MRPYKVQSTNTAACRILASDPVYASLAVT